MASERQRYGWNQLSRIRNRIGRKKSVPDPTRQQHWQGLRWLEPGGRARIQAEVPQPAEQTHPQLVEAAHLAVAGQVRQDLRLGNDRNCSSKKELWKIRNRKNIKGTVLRDGYFLKGLNILISTFCVWFSRPLKSFSLPYTIVNFLFASLKLGYLLIEFEFFIN
jgi:hypothetical protein